LGTFQNDERRDFQSGNRRLFQESQLAKVIEKNTELTIANSDLQKKVVELHGVSEECQTLKTTLVSFRELAPTNLIVDSTIYYII